MLWAILLSTVYNAVLFASPLVALDTKWTVDGGEASHFEDLPVLHTAFVQTGEELHYLSTTVQPDSYKYLSEGEAALKKKHPRKKISKFKEKTFNVKKLAGTGNLPLEFDPPNVVFDDTCVGKPLRRKVYVSNVLNEPIILDAIISNSVDFHSSFFDDIKLEPKASASFEIAYQPRELGKRKVLFHIYSSFGIFSLEVSGRCVANPYRIAPFVGIVVPFNGSAVKPLVIYNPHPYTLRITEISTSGGNSHVELPQFIDESVAAEIPQHWDIRPFQSKKVANIVIVGGNVENSTLFVRVAGMHPETKKDINDIFFTIPIEVTKRRGVFTTSEILDFGMLRYGDRSDPQLFSVYQYQLRGRLEFEMLYVEKGDHTGIYMEFAATPPIPVMSAKHPNAPGEPSDLVKVFFDASRIEFPNNDPAIKKFAGHIIAVSRGGNYNVSMPFRARVFQGRISSVGNDLALQDDLRPPHQRTVRLQNNLPFDVFVWNISMSSDAQNYFSVRLLDNVVKLEKGSSCPVFVLKYNKRVPTSFDNAIFYIYTDYYTFRVVMNRFSGKMNVDVATVDKQSFDFGLIERNDTRTIRFTVWNKNKAEMHLRQLSVPSRNAYRLYHVAMHEKDSLTPTVNDDERSEYVLATDVDIPTESGAVFDLELKVPIDGVVYAGNILFETDYESKLFPVSYEVVPTGTLHSIPDHINFGATFPAKLVYRTLQVFNSFAEDMTVTRLTTLSQDSRFFFESFDPNQPPLLKSGRLTNLGRVMFSPKIPCTHEPCYLGFPLNSTDGQWFVHGLNLPANLAEVDSYLYKKQRSKFDAMVKSRKNWVNTTVILDTDKAKNIKIKTTAELVWPRLLTRNSIEFPLTALGNFTIVNLTLSNPTSVAIAVQVIPLVIYPDAETLVDLFRPYLMTPLTGHVETNETLMFSLRDTELFTLKPDSPVPKLREELESIIPNNPIPRFTLSLLLKPHMKVRLRIGFLPSDYAPRSSLLLIRNNLTVMEPLVMYGKGARLGMKVEGVGPRSLQPLLFEIRHDHLTDCNNPKRLMHKLHSTLTVRRPFAVVNTGEVPFLVTNMSVNGVPCENRGFRILNCYSFRLHPNESYSLDIAYTPDFLTTTNEADLQLYMHMNGSAWLFPLAATVPADMLAKCHQALPRPPFENIMYYSCVTALIFCLVCVLACAYLEGDRAIACAIRQQYAVPRTVFDLKNLASNANAKTPESPKPKAMNGDTPSALKASDDSWFVYRMGIQGFNFVVQIVFSFWRFTLYLRDKGEKEDNKSNAKKKKKNKVSVVNSKKDMANVDDKGESSEVHSLKTNVSESSTQTQTSKKTGNSRAVQSSKSPKVDARRDETKIPEERLSRPATQHTTASSASNNNKPPEPQRRPEKPEKPEKSKIEKPIRTSKVEPKKQKPQIREPSAKNDSNIAQAVPPVNDPKTIKWISNSDYNFVDLEPNEGWNYNEFKVPQTPTPSIASSYTRSHEAECGMRLQQDGEYLNDDDESLASNGSPPPNWADEPILNGDADEDMNDLAAATSQFFMDSADERTPSPIFTPQLAHGKKNDVFAFEDGTKKLDARRKTVGSERSEKKAEQERQQLLDLELSSSFLPASDPNDALLNWPVFDDETNFTTAPWPPNASTNLLIEHPAPLENPMSLYQNLGMSFGTSIEPSTSATLLGNSLFGGREQGIWSNSNPLDPPAIWSLGLLESDNEKSNDDDPAEK